MSHGGPNKLPSRVAYSITDEEGPFVPGPRTISRFMPSNSGILGQAVIVPEPLPPGNP